MTQGQVEKARNLAKNHWCYVKGILDRNSFLAPHIIEEMGQQYMEAMEHGFGHGYECCEMEKKI